VRLNRTDGAGAVVGPVAEAQPLMVAAGAGERGQHRRVDRRGGRVGRDWHGVVGQRAHPAAQPGWQFRNIRQALPDLAGAPKPGKPGPRRPPGSKNRRPATRHDVGKTIKRDQPDKKTRRQKG
jgi:hypothetical protein